MKDETPLPCCYCGTMPTLIRPDLKGTSKEGPQWENMGKLICFEVGCPGQKNMQFTFGYVRIWNQRQRAYGRAIEKAKAVIPALVAHAL